MGMVEHVHFVGVGGIGMSGLALLAHGRGMKVTGSDCAKGVQVKRLQAKGITVHFGHDASFVGEAQWVVYSTAIADDNPELLAARDLGMPLLHRSEFLSRLMADKCGLLVAGSHGKTTTTSLLTHLWLQADLKPSFAIGGVPLMQQDVAQWGEGPDFIAEADESDGSFLKLNAQSVIVTNIDQDHLEYYQHDFDLLQKAFVAFMDGVDKEGVVVACIDDPVVASCVERTTSRVLTYGFKPSADFRICRMLVEDHGLCLQIHAPKWGDVEVCVPVFGEHNALNTMAVLALAQHHGLDLDVIREGLQSFEGVARRFEYKGHINLTRGLADWYDDYGHHPTELEAVIRMVRQRWPDRRLVMCFQPHRYTRTQSLFQSFVDALGLCDAVVLCPTYAAGEDPINGADDEALIKALKAQNVAVQPLGAWAKHWQTDLRPGDVLLTQGAGDVTHLVGSLFETYH